MIENMRRGEWRRHVSIAEAMRYEQGEDWNQRKGERDRPCDTSVALRAVNTPDTWLRCVMERQYPTREREIKLTTSVANGFTLGISAP